MTSQSQGIRDFATAVAAERLFVRVMQLLRADAGLIAPIKGLALHRSTYDSPHERPLTDVDLLLSPSIYKRSLARLRANGFSVMGRGATGHTLVHKGEVLALDLHHQLFPHGMFALDTDQIFARASWSRLDSVHFRMLDDYDTYACLVGHFVKGRLGPNDTVHLRDLVRFASVRELAPDQAAAHLLEHGLARAAHTVLPLVCERHDDAFSKELLAHLRIGPVTRVAATLLVRHRERVDAWGVTRRLWPYAFDRDAKRGVINATRHASVGAIRRIVASPTQALKP